MRVICSIGPRVRCNQDFDNLIKAGMQDARFNFSHIDYEKVKTDFEYLKKNYENVRIIQDLQGNKIRVSNLCRNEFKVVENEEVFFCSESFYKTQLKNRKLIPIKSDFSFIDLCKTPRIFMKDRTMEFKVIGKVKNHEVIKTKVIRGGIIRREKGLNFLNIDRSKSRLTEKDKNDIIFGIKNEVNIICLSYVGSKDEFLEFKNFVKVEIKNQKKTNYKPILWAKIECENGVIDFDEIVKSADGIMLGRGDLYSEFDIYEVSSIQNEIIQKMKRKKTKECIIATYVLESMKRNSIPTISELNEINYFIDEKVDSVMLAGEVTIGNNPIGTVKFISNFIDKKIGKA
ncbi:MAG: pyruvate kinase [Sarcina sp.]